MDATDAPEQPSKSKDGPEFDPSRRLVDLCLPRKYEFISKLQVIGIIKRKALIKELAAAYHAECLAYCQKLQQLQRKWEEEQQYIKRKTPQEVGLGKSKAKPSKRQKKRP